jgi:hypothetical protein
MQLAHFDSRRQWRLFRPQVTVFDVEQLHASRPIPLSTGELIARFFAKLLLRWLTQGPVHTSGNCVLREC